jgi:hypothetical protein
MGHGSRVEVSVSCSALTLAAALEKNLAKNLASGQPLNALRSDGPNDKIDELPTKNRM